MKRVVFPGFIECREYTETSDSEEDTAETSNCDANYFENKKRETVLAMKLQQLYEVKVKQGRYTEANY